MTFFSCCQILSTLFLVPLKASEPTALPIHPVDLSENEEEHSIDTALCSKEILMSFFPQPVLKNVLIKHKVSEETADKIAKELSHKDQEVVKTVEHKAGEMEPNPLNDLSQRDLAIKIFRETLFQVFSQSLKDNKLSFDDAQIQTILDDMQEAKGKLFVECIKKEKNNHKL